MTLEELHAACTDIDVGWSPLSPHNGAAIISPPTDYCNESHCGSVAIIGTDAGVTPAEAAAAIKSNILGDSQPLRDLMELARIERLG